MTPAPGLYKGLSYYGQSEQILFAQRGQSREAFPQGEKIKKIREIIKQKSINKRIFDNKTMKYQSK